jgi:hypothetical protein
MIDHPDIIAGLINGVDGIFVWSNVYRLYRDKCVRGVNWFPSVYFTLSTLYGTYFLYHLNARYAFIGLSISTAAKFVWMILASIYIHKERHYTRLIANQYRHQQSDT